MDDQIDEGKVTETRLLWLEEIVRETEHFFQAEVQQDQRGSWLLASVAVLIVAWASIELEILEKSYGVSQILMMIALVSFVICGFVIVVNILPLRGHKNLRDLFGTKYRREFQLTPNKLVERRFRLDESWSKESHLERIIYHYRIHYLRNFRKANGVLLSSMILLIGLIAFALALASLPFAI